MRGIVNEDKISSYIQNPTLHIPWCARPRSHSLLLTAWALLNMRITYYLIAAKHAMSLGSRAIVPISTQQCEWCPRFKSRFLSIKRLVSCFLSMRWCKCRPPNILSNRAQDDKCRHFLPILTGTIHVPRVTWSGPLSEAHASVSYTWFSSDWTTWATAQTVRHFRLYKYRQILTLIKTHRMSCLTTMI